MNQSVGNEQGNRLIELKLKEQVILALKAPIPGRILAIFAML